ncbi:hypothetical protein [Streptomyces sp. NPDC101149]|uniref:hypothetical protein n=1 Tax=Streptomyces sp. NPDC101149 TaxID=3366113 RepID=UPI003821A3FE
MADDRREEAFYERDRPERPTLKEDRPRGGKPKAPAKHRGPWFAVAVVAVVILLIILGIALFP